MFDTQNRFAKDASCQMMREKKISPDPSFQKRGMKDPLLLKRRARVDLSL
jgi:hypothetical protein